MESVGKGDNTLLVSERRRGNRKDPLVSRLEKERDDPHFQIPDGARVITLKSWVKDPVSVDTESFRSWFGVDEHGLLTPKALPTEMQEAKVRWFRNGLRRDGRLYQRVMAMAKRTSIRNPNRPQSTSPVKAFGLNELGPEMVVTRGTTLGRVLSNTLTTEENAALKERLDKEFKYIAEVDETRIKLTEASDDPVVRFLDGAEKHQVLTGGGYDNTYVGQAREVNFDWLSSETPSIDGTMLSQIVMSQINLLKQQYASAGITERSLDLVDYYKVRDESNSDGTIGCPVCVHGKDIFTVEIANSLRDAYGVDMRSYVGAYVKLADYTGPVCVKHALNDLPFLMDSIGAQVMLMLTLLLSRTQRKGYEELGKPKKGKFRSIKMPEALHAIMSGSIATAFKLKANSSGVTTPLLAGQLPLQKQIEVIYSEIEEMVGRGFTGFPLDESGYDSSLLASIMATILINVYMPLFKEKYEPIFWAVAWGFSNKLVVTPTLKEEDEYYASHDMSPPKTPKNSFVIPGFVITYIQDKLLSGDYLTQRLGSDYNFLVVQRTTYVQLGYADRVPFDKGKALGDDVAMYFPISMVRTLGIEKFLALVQQALANYGIVVNVAKQYVFEYQNEYLVVFLQRYYHAGLKIKGVGSPARSMAGAPFSEYSPLESRPPQNMALQEIGVLSVMNNFANNPLADGWVEFYFNKDRDMLSIFQMYGEDIEIYDGFAKNDWVVYTNGAYTATGIDNYAKAEVKTASVDGIRDTTGEYRIDGSWFEKGANSNVTGVTIALNDELEYVAMGGYLFYAKVKESETSSKDIAMVISTDQDSTLSGVQSSSIKAKLVFTDGTKKTVGVATVNGDPATYNATAATNATTNVTARIGKLVTYTVNSDGDYELKDVSSSNKAGYKGVGSNAAYSNKAIGGKELADDAVVFVYKGTANAAANTNDGKVYTGKEIKNAYGAGTVGTALTVVASNANVACLYDTVNGFEYAKVAVLETTGGVTINAGSNYGYLVANAYETKEDGKTYTNLKFWDGGKDVEAKWEKSGVLDQFKAGVVITYDVKDAGEVKNVAVKTATVGVVTGWDDAKKIQLAGVGGTREINDDTVIMTINSKDKKGVEGASVSSIVIGEDTNNDDTADQANVRYIVGTTYVDLLIIDVNNDMKAAPVAQIAGSATATAAITAALNGADKVVVTGATTVDTALAIGEGKTVVIDGAATLSADVTGAGKLVVNSFADAATSAAHAKTSTVEIVNAATVATIEAVPVVANKKLILGEKSSDAATDTTVGEDLKFWATTGKAPVADPATAGENGTSALLAAPDANKIAAGTYVAGTVYYETSAAGDTTATAWVKQ